MKTYGYLDYYGKEHELTEVELIKKGGIEKFFGGSQLVVKWWIK